MKKLFFAFAVAMLLLPATLWANTAKKKIKSVEITMDAPTPGMDLEDAEKLALKAVNTAYGDLFKSGVITLREISWDGEFGENKKGYPTLKAGYPYIATIQIMIDTNGERLPTAYASTTHASNRSNGSTHARFAASANATKRTPSAAEREQKYWNGTPWART